MEIKTKYSIGETVWYVGDDLCERVLACGTCGDTKEVAIKGESFKCPNCVTGHNNFLWKRRHYVRGSSRIGSVRYELTVERYDDPKEERIYMLDATGIGSGTLWRENLLFPTRDEAQAYCDSENAKETE